MIREITAFAIGTLAGALMMMAVNAATIDRTIDRALERHATASPTSTAAAPTATNAITETASPTADATVSPSPSPTGAPLGFMTNTPHLPTATSAPTPTEPASPTAEAFANKHAACAALNVDALNPVSGCNVAQNPYLSVGRTRGGEFYPDGWLLLGSWACRAGGCRLALPASGSLTQPLRLFGGQCYRALVIVEGRGGRGSDWPADALQIAVGLGDDVQRASVSRPPVRPTDGLFAYASSFEPTWRVARDGQYDFSITITASGQWAAGSDATVTNAHLFAVPNQFCGGSG